MASTRSPSTTGTRSCASRRRPSGTGGSTVHRPLIAEGRGDPGRPRGGLRRHAPPARAGLIDNRQHGAAEAVADVRRRRGSSRAPGVVDQPSTHGQPWRAHRRRPHRRCIAGVMAAPRRRRPAHRDHLRRGHHGSPGCASTSATTACCTTSTTGRSPTRWASQAPRRHLPPCPRRPRRRRPGHGGAHRRPAAPTPAAPGPPA